MASAKDSRLREIADLSKTAAIGAMIKTIRDTTKAIGFELLLLSRRPPKNIMRIKKSDKIAFFNPNVVGVSREEIAMEEGCLSFPGFYLTLKRPAEVVLEWQNEKGETQTGKFQGVGARVVLHEYDHMEGINFTFHASHFKLKWELDKWKKRQLKHQKRLRYGK